MNIAPFDKERLYDAYLDKVVDGFGDGINDDDDGLIICGGGPGTGKTRLMFHAYTRFAGDLAVISQIAMTQRDFALAIDSARRMKTKRFAGYDEANVSRRDAMTKWNRKLIDLYMNIRGLNIFHWWNNPSLEMLDKPFIEERVKGVIFIITKDKNRPRLYYYFTKEGLLQMLEEKKDLKKNTITKYGNQYAFYMGWFKDYRGPLLEAYNIMKRDRMAEKVIAFKDEFAPTDKKSMAQYSQEVSIDQGTAKKILLYGVESALLKEGEHFLRTGTGQVKLLPNGVDAMEYIRVNDLHRTQRRKHGLGPVSSRLQPIVHSIYLRGDKHNG